MFVVRNILGKFHKKNPPKVSENEEKLVELRGCQRGRI